MLLVFVKLSKRRDLIAFIGRTIRTARPFRTDSTRSSLDRVLKTRQLKVRVSLINNRSMENKHFIGQSKTDGIPGELEAANVRPVVFSPGRTSTPIFLKADRKQCKINLIQFITPKYVYIRRNKYFIRKKKGTIVSVRKSQEDMRF